MVDRQAYWHNRKVFITGANGFVGSWLTDELINYGAKVTVLEKEVLKNSVFEQKQLRNKCIIVPGILENFALLESILTKNKPNTVFHLAAQTQVKSAYTDPLTNFESNIRGTYNLLEAIRRHSKDSKLIVASSDKAYGSHEKMPYTEDYALQGKGPYDVSKSCVDLLSQSYFKTYELNVTISRCGNFFGPGDLNFDRIVPDSIRSIINNQQLIIRSDGTYTRDYIYVKDAADSYLTLGEKMEELNLAGEAFNFTNEKQLSVLGMYGLIAKLMKSKLTPKITNTAKAEIRHQHLSGEKAKRILNWTAKYSIEPGLKETIPWYIELLKR